MVTVVHAPRAPEVAALLAAHPLADHVRPGPEPGGTVVHFFDSAPITADDLDAFRPAEVIIAGPATGTVDLAAARARGVAVLDTPGLAAHSVAEYALGLTLALMRALPSTDTQQWTPRFGSEVAGSTLGVVGTGDVGRRLTTLARGLGMTVLGWSPRSTVAGLSLDEVLSRSDAVSVHLRLAAETEGLIDADRLRAMKPTAVLINTARSAIVDSVALREALAAGTIAGAAIDVFDAEPVPPTDPWWRAENVIVSPHAAWMTIQAADRFLDAALQYAVHRDRRAVRTVLPATKMHAS
ncbi:D-isomer specific 2-hydroxyacid dehydrogenase NAD-binding protein OS=Tsukamurella paurometabola (strain ATCC 8368 / DSM / CCUG 35730 / CIP 100753 / JCM 10117 / KCTC 9821 / NBRC 16120 / NCIMB 702349 / NCTC 13040)OX=521096 GN=Tpau_1544 PE=3 SV=1 [Tsukamurella paurometabola]|uniref:D-isomer specific 2-hydroxyacid dehydrogenase NAD-binding protein n=1 Tax=Tsukamurella paurometabola (strain ATCC 8368 / DSM 20162 / CCUG 35730 / CIP 100753 / JCM 10117 / KCTC 9821 / NBRC 16120 / NCIMB 702349 / NCTC 13040) TaxID=521096 RepID=D5UY59_TSUPD|nr:NAD(P)-dependent oxidoreductase [Tsukamurella paurometabola]ADG78166.1 D-isomer specific 2-hydroxyacid dehydrogenase NAD-binding protein [Tsukamurella paurometabola DSM 20162]SUP30498.1 Glycerate dehydrogenase [Tsukamurella paurometabola]